MSSIASFDGVRRNLDCRARVVTSKVVNGYGWQRIGLPMASRRHEQGERQGAAARGSRDKEPNEKVYSRSVPGQPELRLEFSRKRVRRGVRFSDTGATS